MEVIRDDVRDSVRMAYRDATDEPSRHLWTGDRRFPVLADPVELPPL